jgi:very-short-patch-repair endonuclease
MTWQERLLWSILRNRNFLGYKFRRQMIIGNYVVDFVCLEQRLIVELDGRGHLDQREYDESRTASLESQGFCVVRFWNAEMEEDINKVMETILSRLRTATPHPPAPSPSRGEGEIVAIASETGGK